MTLASIPAFAGLSPATLRALRQASRPVTFGAGAVLRAAGEPAEAVVLLLSGSVVAAYAGPDGEQVWPACWAGPAIVDKPAALGGGRPATGLLATTACAARLLPGGRFLQLLEDERSVRQHVLAHLAWDVQEQRRRFVQATTTTAISRVAGWLSAAPAGDPIAWRGSQQELAHFLGLSRVTVHRALQALVRAGAVQMARPGIRVLDRGRLEAFRPAV